MLGLVADAKMMPQKSKGAYCGLFKHPKSLQKKAEEYISKPPPGIVHGKLVRSEIRYLSMGNKHVGVLIGSPVTTDVEFQSLVDQWKKDTLGVSSVSDMVLHPAYQRIMSMGKPALPLILQELRRELDHWFYALEFIVGTEGKDVAQGADTLEDARSAWLEWGYKNGYL
jgi:hypothetical protein